MLHCQHEISLFNHISQCCGARDFEVLPNVVMRMRRRRESHPARTAVHGDYRCARGEDIHSYQGMGNGQGASRIKVGVKYGGACTAVVYIIREGTLCEE